MKMPPKGSLCRLIVSKFGFAPDSDDFYAVFAHSLSYITRGIGYSEFQNRLKPFCRDLDFSAKDFRLWLHDTEYLSLALKLYVLRLAKVRRLDLDHAKDFAREYGLFNCDARRIYSFWKEQRRFRVRLAKEAKKYDADVHLNRALLSAALAEVMKPVMKKIKAFTYRKLRFIAKSQNRELSDLHAELKIAVIEAFYKLMPSTMTVDHVVNYLKKTAHTRGLNIISANTSLKAGRLVSDDEGRSGSFSLLVVSENQMKITAEEDPVRYEELAGHDPIAQVDDEHSVNSLMATVKPGGKKHRFLTILMGFDDAPFTSWLQRNRYCSVRETNSDLQARECPIKFNVLLGRFLHVSHEQVTRFMGSLRARLEPTEMAQAA